MRSRARISTRGRLAGLAAGAVAAIACAALPAAAAAGPIEITSYSAGLSESQASGHPDVQVSFRFATELGSVPGPGANGGTVVKGGAPKDVVVDLPRGVFANPKVIAQCTVNDLTDSRCPTAANVGMMQTYLVFDGAPSGPFPQPVYNMVPDRGEVAKLGVRVAGATNSFISVRVSPEGDYRLVTTVANIYTGLPLWGADLTIWGSPYSAENDDERTCTVGGTPVTPCAAEIPPVPFMVAPAECGVDQVTTLRVRPYQAAGDDGWTTAESAPQQMSGCEHQPFAPTVDVRPTTTAPDAPTGLELDMRFPQYYNHPDGIETPPLRDVKVTLPEGMTINPSSADGLAACSDAQLGIGTSSPVECPAASTIGVADAETPVLDERLEGRVYVRRQASDDPASGELFRLAIVLENRERGLRIKLPGAVRANPDSGRIETVFANNPQLPVSRMSVRLDAGPRASLATPASCGSKTASVELVSWGGQTVTRDDSFAIDCPGAAGFAPSFAAGSLSPVGGAFSPFAVRIDRADRDQYVSDVSVDLPEGMLAKLAGVPLCSSLAAEQGGCPSGSRIGTATVAAGAGTNPYHLSGDVYLTEGYKGGPYGLAVHVDVKAGPYDLGWVRVRQALYVDPATTEISVVSDPLPRIVRGVPVRLRGVDVDVDRAGFSVNPTSCAAKRIGARLTSVDGAVHTTASGFRATDCRALGFEPRLALRLLGKGRTRTGAHPALRAVLTQGEGQANVGRAQVTLPGSVVLDPRNSNDPALLCGYDAGLASNCPASSVIGKATAHTPLLNRPLTGAVHLVQGIRFGPSGNRIRTTPTLLVKLRGEVDVDLRARTTVKGNRLVTTFPDVPDARVARFSLQIAGGAKGILVVTRTRKGKIDVCRSKQVANVETDGQNGKPHDFRARIATPCPKRDGSSRRTAR